jgi:hypothetical protein
MYKKLEINSIMEYNIITKSQLSTLNQTKRIKKGKNIKFRMLSFKKMRGKSKPNDSHSVTPKS